MSKLGLLKRADVAVEDVTHFVPHQANGIMLAELVDKAGLSEATTHLTLDRYGNVGSASVPVTLDEAARKGALKRSQVGGGLRGGHGRTVARR